MTSSGTVLWIAGASSGIGEAVAREWVRRGGRVALSARRGDRLELLAQELNAAAREKSGHSAEAVALVIPADVTRDGDCERAVEATVRAFGRLDVAFANAGFGVSAEVELLELDDFRRQFETNIYGVIRASKASLPELKKSRGLFVVTGSVLGHLSLPGGAPYAMSKFAVRAFADAIRTEWAPHGVGVTLISPGFIQSEIRRVDNSGKFRPEFRDPVPAWLVYSVAAAAREIVDAMEQKRVEAIISFHGKLMVWLSRFFPGVVRRWIAPRFATPPGKRGWSHENSSG